MGTNLLRKNNAKKMIDMLSGSRVNFNLTCSNYTALIESNYLKEKYISSMQSNRTFAAFSKVKHDVKDKPVPFIDREQLRYFQHDFKKTVYYPTVYNIDLKSAYATILFNDGYITKETFHYLSRLQKPERLACVGMLASKKQYFTFKGGKAVDTSYSESPLSNFFYHAVQRTDEIMSELKQMCNHSYLFTWVDGIYYGDDNATKTLSDYLEFHNLRNSYEILSDFNVRVYEAKIRVSYIKEGVKKEMNMPTSNTDFKRIFTNAIQDLAGQTPGSILKIKNR